QHQTTRKTTRKIAVNRFNNTQTRIRSEMAEFTTKLVEALLERSKDKAVERTEKLRARGAGVLMLQARAGKGQWFHQVQIDGKRQKIRLGAVKLSRADLG